MIAVGVVIGGVAALGVVNAGTAVLESLFGWLMLPHSGFRG